MRVPAALALLAVLLAAAAANAVITKLTPLAEVLENEDFIFVAAIDKVDAEKPAAVFKLDKKLKGDVPFDRLAVNMTGTDEAKKAGDTKTILDRLDPARKAVFFVGKRGKTYTAMAFVEGSWFSVKGTEDPADKTVRWAFQNGEPYLRRTFKGTTAELVQVIEDGLAKKAKPPAPDDKEKPGYGPAVEKKPESPFSRDAERSAPPTRLGGALRSAPRLNDSGFHSAFRGPHSALLGVIPSFVLVGPLAVAAALFPGLFARMAVGMKRWRAFLVVASVNSTLALVYYFTQHWLPAGFWFGPKAFTIYLLAITLVGLCWAGRRYRRMAAAEPQVTDTPTRTELISLAGLTAFAGLVVVVTAAFASWGTNLELPLREFTFIGVALAAAFLYAGYRFVTRGVDGGADRRLSLSGETVGLGTLFLSGLCAVLLGGRTTGPVATGTEAGNAGTIGPRLVGDPKVFGVKKASQVMSGVTVAGDRLYFGTQFTRLQQQGQLVCLDRETGEERWRFGDDDEMLPVYCTPTAADGRVYCGEGLHDHSGCRLFCVDAATGQPAWAKPFATTSHTEGAPAVAGGLVFFPAGDDGLIAADAKTGAERWRFRGGKEAGIHIDAAPAAGGGRVFVGSGLYAFVAVCLDATTGKEVWRTDLTLRAFGAPLLLGKQVYYGVGTGNMTADTHNYPEEGAPKETAAAGAVVCLDVASGKEQWRFDLPRSVHNGLAGDAFSVYAASRDGFVYALDRKTGKLRWKTGIGGAVTSTPAVATAGGMPVAVYAVSREGLAACLNPHTGLVVWQKPLPGFRWDGQEANGVLGGVAVVTTLTPTGSRRAIYVGAMTVDPDNDARKTAAVFRFDDEIE